MKIEDFKIILEEICLDSIRSCSKYEFREASGRASFLAGYFEADYPFLSELFDFISTGKHSEINEIPF